MERFDYFLKVLNVIDKKEKYNWSSIPITKILPSNYENLLNYYDTQIGGNEKNELYLAFIQYSYYNYIDENESVLFSDYALIFYIKEGKDFIKSLLLMNSKEYNTYLLETNKAFESYSLPDVMRKISEKEINIAELFKDI
ncbi:hypothetical protein KFV08_09950 [Macrococcoides canis]|uniref:hypothetical protein n=1 Tax=Macrococcoides canis TaxID=1855823 RepID=UPI0020B89952|nr:hypothetical protein [Macrococcus canis]UTH08798.1 hypothetical protein KFV08_09950 [Macrococcus canis]